MPVRVRPTLPFKAGYARGRGEAATRTRQMQFKVAFEETRQQNVMQQLTARFQDAQKRLQMASEIQQKTEQDKAQAESLGIMAAMRGEELVSDNPYTSMAFAETRRQMGVEIPQEELGGFAEALGYDPELAEKIPKVWRGLPRAARGAIVSRAPALARGKPAVAGLMGQVSQAAREFILRKGEPASPEEFRTQLKAFHKVQWEETQAKSRTEAMNDAEEAFRSIYSDVSGEEGYKAQFSSIEGWLESIGFSKAEIASVAKIDYKGRNRTIVQWSKLRNMLFQKRLARMETPGRPPEGEPGVERKSGKFRTLAEDILK